MPQKPEWRLLLVLDKDILTSLDSPEIDTMDLAKEVIPGLYGEFTRKSVLR
jgi:hypothetical protein